jgi:hypothetical protein
VSGALDRADIAEKRKVFGFDDRPHHELFLGAGRATGPIMIDAPAVAPSNQIVVK